MANRGRRNIRSANIGSGGFKRGQPPIPGGPSKIPGTPSAVPQLGTFPSPQAVQLRDVQGRFVKGGWGFQWTGLEGVFGLPQAFATQLDEGIRDALETITGEVERYAKENAPWTDHTGDARSGLKAVLLVNTASGRYVIELGHSVPYGHYLETANGGKFAIVEPTIRHFAPQLLANVVKA